jgi:hypothetical protein
MLPQGEGELEEKEASLQEMAAQSSELLIALEAQKTIASSIQSEFEAYKKEYKISGNLGALQTAVAAMQAKLVEKEK